MSIGTDQNGCHKTDISDSVTGLGTESDENAAWGNLLGFIGNTVQTNHSVCSLVLEAPHVWRKLSGLCVMFNKLDSIALCITTHSHGQIKSQTYGYKLKLVN